MLNAWNVGIIFLAYAAVRAYCRYATVAPSARTPRIITPTLPNCTEAAAGDPWCLVSYRGSKTRHFTALPSTPVTPVPNSFQGYELHHNKR